MEREILFRGKRADNSKWAYGIPVEVEAEIGIKEFIVTNAKWECGDNSIDFLETDVYEIIPDTRSQYTGLTDKNGRKIFEGDIIKNHKEDTGVIQWFKEHSAFMIFCTNQNKVYFLYDNDFSKIEVIGNIHDNPELI